MRVGCLSLRSCVERATNALVRIKKDQVYLSWGNKKKVEEDQKSY